MNSKSMDYPVFIITVMLVALGIVMVFSASYYYAMYTTSANDGLHFFKKQIFWAVFGLGAMIFLSYVPYSWIRKLRLSWISIIVSVLLLILVLVFGQERYGAKRWFSIAGQSFQPVEFVKVSVIIFLADMLSKDPQTVRKFAKGVFPYMALLGLIFGLIYLQPNFSSASSILMLGMIILFVAGMKLWHMIIIGGIGGLAVWQLVSTESYRVARMTSFVDPWAYESGDGYQLIQSFYALSSGGKFGVGLGESRQKFLFLPSAETDFIFSIFGEEFGFVGSVALIMMYVFLIYRGIRIAIKAKDMFGCLLATGVITIISIQFLLHIMVVTGLFPTTGLPLPFISAGGTSLFAFMCSIGLLLSVSRFSGSQSV